MNSLIIGRGEIGKAVENVILRTDRVSTYDKTDDDRAFELSPDILHICFPYSEEFIEQVEAYIEAFKPWHVIIWSTVPIGTTKEIKGAVHSPVEGRHPLLTESIRNMCRWVGTNDEVEGEFYRSYFREIGLAVRLVSCSDFTEALKLLSTTEYGVNIEFARYKKQVADSIGMDFELTKDWNKDYNKLYHNLGMDWAQKYILDTPTGAKGGHCVTPNARLLYDQFPDELVKIVGEMQ